MPSVPLAAPLHRLRSPVVVLAVVVVAAMVAVGAFLVYRRSTGGFEPPTTNVQRPAPPLVASDDPARGDVRFAERGTIVGPEAEVLVSAPPGAIEMQVGLDPTFRTTPWSPVAESVTITVPDVGHQMLFGRFRSAPDAQPSPVSVDGITIDPTREAAVASVDGLHRPSWARPLSATSLVVRIEAGRIERGGQITYDVAAPPDGDEVSGGGERRTVSRHGEPFGRQVAGHPELLRVFDRLIGRPLDGEALTSGSWSVVSTDDPRFADGVVVAGVERITRPTDEGIGSGDEGFTALAHDVVLSFSEPLTAGRRYEIRGPEELVEPVELFLDPNATVSPAVHVNQKGYAPGDGLKVGYLSGLPGSLGSTTYRAGMPFAVIDVANGMIVHRGSTTARPGGDELGSGDLTGSEVFELDFSPVASRGRYRVCVEGVGCSEEFEIDDEVWDELTVVVARAMYHQRSGIALGPPYTSVARPRPYHPDDGLVVVRSDVRLLDTFERPAERFVDLVAAATDVDVLDAWGGHFDAGDWDRRIEHLYYVRAVAELVEAHPDHFADVPLGIPESDNEIPDLLDEGLWTLDLFRRLQRPEGGVPGGIEAAEHPLPDETSWSDSLAVYTYEPDPFASYLYAGVAAQTAAVLRAYDATEADRYVASAVAAMEWANAQPTDAAASELLAAHRSVAAVALYKATGDERWHTEFRETTTLGQGIDAFLSCHEHTRCDAAWLYVSLDATRTDPDLRSTVEASIVATAEEIVAAAEQTSFGWTVENRFVPLIWGLGVGGSPNAVGLLRAYELTGDERYLGAAQRSAAVTLGANPINTVYLTGVGRQPARNPLIVDAINGGLPVWAGTPVYGNHRLDLSSEDDWVEEFVLGPAGVDPLPSELPYLWQWFDVPSVAMYNEFTVHQSHAQAIYAFGLLAAASG